MEIREERDWYKQECHSCPYFINDEQFKIRHCVRPLGEVCLFDSCALVQAVYMRDQLCSIAKQINLAEKALPKIHKKIKRKR